MVVCAIGTVKNGMVDNIKKAKKRATVTEIKKDLRSDLYTNPREGTQMTDATAAWFAPS